MKPGYDQFVCLSCRCNAWTCQGRATFPPPSSSGCTSPTSCRGVNPLTIGPKIRQNSMKKLNFTSRQTSSEEKKIFQWKICSKNHIFRCGQSTRNYKICEKWSNREVPTKPVIKKTFNWKKLNKNFALWTQCEKLKLNFR